MRTLELRNGDLTLGSSGYRVVEGQAKLRQDLSLLMREPFGADPLHPKWGSLLVRYIGKPIGEETAMMVKTEINRLISNYSLVQASLLQADSTASRRPRFGTGEVVDSVLGIDVQQHWDRLKIRVTVATLSGDRITLIQAVEP